MDYIQPLRDAITFMNGDDLVLMDVAIPLEIAVGLYIKVKHLGEYHV